MQTQLVCPHCGSTLTFGAEIKAGAAVTCLICSQAFAAANPTPVSASPIKPGPAPSVPPGAIAQIKTPTKSGAATKASAPTTAASTTRVRRPVEEPGSNVAMLAFTIVLLVLLTAGVGYGLWRITMTARQTPDDDKQLVDNKDADKKADAKDKDKDKKPEVQDPQPDPDKDTNAVTTDKKYDKKYDEKDNVKPPPPLTKEEEDDIRKKVQDETKKVLQRKNPPKVATPDPDPDPLPVVVKKGPVEQQQINDALEKGIAFLKKTQLQSGSWSSQYEIGHASLGGLTLLECKVDPKDKFVQNAARCVRDRLSACTLTYELSLAILFLDRLGDPADKVRIQEAALRLISGQKVGGGWFYTCREIPQQEVRSLWLFLQSHRPPAKGVKGVAPIRVDQMSPLLREVMSVKFQGVKKGQLPATKIHRMGDPIGNFDTVQCDNSNTQFAILALWAARRHDVNVDQALLIAWKYFMDTQNPDGGWGYMAGQTTTSTMVNVGLLGLAIGHGASPDVDPKNPKAFRPALKDENIQKGLQMLSRYIGEPIPNATKAGLKMENLYMLWCIERVAMLYDLQTIGGKDWYGWGAQILVKHQGTDGAWDSNYHGTNPQISACFALLFLRRSNLVQDLTHTFRFHSGIRDEK